MSQVPRKGPRPAPPVDVKWRLGLFDAATERQRRRESRRRGKQDRGWKRAELYDRERPR